MNTSRITVRLDAEHREAELEMLLPHESATPRSLEESLQRVGMRPFSTVEMTTPRYRVTRTKFAELDGSRIDAIRVMQVLRAARSREFENASCCRAA